MTDTTMESFAKAVDTICCPNQSEKQPMHQFVLLKINEVKDSPGHGSTLPQSECHREQTACKVVGPQN